MYTSQHRREPGWYNGPSRLSSLLRFLPARVPLMKHFSFLESESTERGNAFSVSSTNTPSRSRISLHIGRRDAWEGKAEQDGYKGIASICTSAVEEWKHAVLGTCVGHGLVANQLVRRFCEGLGPAKGLCNALYDEEGRQVSLPTHTLKEEDETLRNLEREVWYSVDRRERRQRSSRRLGQTGKTGGQDDVLHIRSVDHMYDWLWKVVDGPRRRWSLLELPREILFLVLDRLPLQNLLGLRLISKEMCVCVSLYRPSTPIYAVGLDKAQRVAATVPHCSMAFYFINPDPPNISMEVWDLQCISELDLFRGCLEDVPCEVLLLPRLTSLKLANNRLTSITKVLQQLTRVQHLDLSGNPLTSLAGLSSMTSLVGLRLAFVHSTLLAASHEELEVLTSLPMLRELDLAGNALDRIPDVVSRLMQLTSLDVSCNRLWCLQCLAPLRRLKMLVASENLVRTLSPTLLAALTDLRALQLADNRIGSLDGLEQLQQLTHLDLEDNWLEVMPCYRQLPRLRNLVLGGNAVLSDGEVWEAQVDVRRRAQSTGGR